MFTNFLICFTSIRLTSIGTKKYMVLDMLACYSSGTVHLIHTLIVGIIYIRVVTYSTLDCWIKHFWLCKFICLCHKSGRDCSLSFLWAANITEALNSGKAVTPVPSVVCGNSLSANY